MSPGMEPRGFRPSTLDVRREAGFECEPAGFGGILVHAMLITTAEKVRVAVFLIVVGSIFAVAGLWVAAWVLRKVRRRDEPKRSAAGRWTRRSVLTAAGASVGCALWGRFGEPYRLEVTHTTIRTNKLRGATRPIRLVQFSDMHCDPTVRLERRLPGIVAECRPDLIVFTGDCVNSPAGLIHFKRCLAEIAGIAPTYVCRGNWELFFHGLDYFGQTGVVELDGSARRVTAAGASFTLAGQAVGNRTALIEALGDAPAEDFTVFLHHYPKEIYELSETGRVDLQLSGHTHGGQVSLPLYGALVTLSGHGKDLERGLYRFKDTTLYINRGIGMEGAAPRIRFGARPEVSVFELVQEG